MKRFIKILLVACIALVGLNSCETYGDYKQDFSPIYPLCGEWVVNIVDNATNVKTKAVIYTYDTADKSSNVMWLWINSKAFGTKCKVDCNPAACTFSGSNLANALYSGTNNVLDGSVVVDGATTPSSGKSDSIHFTYFSSLSNSTYTVDGYRRTGWPEDE